MAKKPFYSKTPAVPEKQIAGKNPIPGPALGEFAPPMAPMHPGRTKALGPAKRAHGFGHPPHAKQGHYRMSGVPTAHRLGASGIRKTPVVNRP